MKRALSLLVLLFVSAVAVSAQQSPSSATSGGRLFFPRNVIWGYSQFDIAPPHNEPDPNLCAANAADFGGKDAPCNAFARYMLSGYVEVRPFARTELRRLFFFGVPTFPAPTTKHLRPANFRNMGNRLVTAALDCSHGRGNRRAPANVAIHRRPQAQDRGVRAVHCRA